MSPLDGGHFELLPADWWSTPGTVRRAQLATAERDTGQLVPVPALEDAELVLDVRPDLGPRVCRQAAQRERQAHVGANASAVS